MRYAPPKNALAKLHRPGPYHLFELRHEVWRRPHADLRADLHLDPQAVRRLAGFDLERYLAVAPVPRKDFADGLEGVAVGRLAQVDGDLAGEALADRIDRRDLRCQDPHRLVVAFQLAAHQHHGAGLDQARAALISLRERDDL